MGMKISIFITQYKIINIIVLGLILKNYEATQIK